MTDPILIAVISTSIAGVALIVSVIALWRAHFTRPKPIVVVGSIRHRIYPIKSENERWFITSFDVPISICNPGAQPILVADLRLKLHFPEIPIPNNHEHIGARWEVDPDQVRKIDKNRFKWLKTLSTKEWMPLVILPKATVVKHLIFEKRWDDPVTQNVIDVDLELYASAETKWSKVANWQLQLDRHTWGELAKAGTSMGYQPKGTSEHRDSTKPHDLHKYIGSKETIPKEGFGVGPSYLDYPDD